MRASDEFGRGSTFTFFIKFEKYIESEYAVVTNDSKGSTERDDVAVYTSDNNVRRVKAEDVVKDTSDKIQQAKEREAEKLEKFRRYDAEMTR